MRLLAPLALALLALAPLALAGMADHGLQAGESMTLRFDEAASIPYYCRPHPTMKAHLEVVAGRPAENATVRLKDLKFAPAHLVVGVGSNVTFVNEDTAFHTVTAEAKGEAHHAAVPLTTSVAVAAVALAAVAFVRRR